MRSVKGKEAVNPAEAKTAPNRAVGTMAVIFSVISICISGGVLWWYGNSITQVMHSGSPEGGLFQLVALIWSAVISTIAVTFALVAFLSTLRSDDKVVRYSAIFALWFSGIFLALHTITLYGYAALTIILAIILYQRRRARKKSSTSGILDKTNK